jgi:predicted dehydrogenase
VIRVAVIGAGHWGPNLIANFHGHRDSEVTVVVDRDPERLRQVLHRYPGVRVTGDAREAIEDDRVDAVVVATPTVTHYPLARTALEAGKHVLLEKPMTDSADRARSLNEIAKRSGRVLLVGHVFLYNPAVQQIKVLLDADELGGIHYIAAVRTNLGPIRADVNASWDLAAHDISVANWWLEAEPEAASAVGGSWINEGLEDAVFATLRYPNNVLVNLHVSWLNPRKIREITVVGDRRMLTFDDMSLEESVRIYDRGVLPEGRPVEFVDSFTSFRASIRMGEVRVLPALRGEPLRAQCEDFLRCIEAGAEPIADARVGVSVVRCLEAIGRSAAAGGREEPVL